MSITHKHNILITYFAHISSFTPQPMSYSLSFESTRFTVPQWQPAFAWSHWNWRINLNNIPKFLSEHATDHTDTLVVRVHVSLINILFRILRHVSYSLPSSSMGIYRTVIRDALSCKQRLQVYRASRAATLFCSSNTTASNSVSSRGLTPALRTW